METTRAQRLQALKGRWHSELLTVPFPSLGVELTNPTTCAEFVVSPRLMTAEPEVNVEHFGVEDPKGLLAALSDQFGPQVDPVILKQAAIILDIFKRDNDTLAAHFAPGNPEADQALHDSYAAEAQAAMQCSGLVAELAKELGISLTSKGERKRG